MTWPPATMTHDEDRADLQRHADEMRRIESFNLCVVRRRRDSIAEISWWVIDDLVGSEVEGHLDRFVALWIRSVWPLRSPRYTSRDLTWDQWPGLPEMGSD